MLIELKVSKAEFSLELDSELIIGFNIRDYYPDIYPYVVLIYSINKSEPFELFCVDLEEAQQICCIIRQAKQTDYSNKYPTKYD